MKFGKKLKEQLQETVPEWRDKYLSYKELKQLIRFISTATPGSVQSTQAVANFIFLLNFEIEKFNSFFLEMEEDFVIRHKELQQRTQRVQEEMGPNGSHPNEIDYKEEIAKIRKYIVNFHGEMVLLINYSNVNYIGLAKILKKYDKRTGGLLRLPFIQKVLEQPFFTTDLISKLIKDLEVIIDVVFHTNHDQQGDNQERKKIINNNKVRIVGQGIFRNTVAALLTMQEIRRGSSTYGHFSLPPLNLSDYELIQYI